VFLLSRQYLFVERKALLEKRGRGTGKEIDMKYDKLKY
jgi:hypothetical protein